jgi:hypothetical protein
MPTQTFNKYKVTYKVTSVTVTKDGSVGKYGDQALVKAVIKGLEKEADWTMEFKVTPKKGKTDTSIVANGFGYPSIDRHPGHVHGKGWKYNIEEGKGSEDRLVVSDTDATLSDIEIDDEAQTIKLNVEITCKAKVLEDTH